MREINVNNLQPRVSEYFQKHSDAIALYEQMNKSAKQTSQKVRFLAPKVFIFVSDDGAKVEVRKLNILERLIRFLGFAYEDSIFSPDQLKNVKKVFATAIKQHKSQEQFLKKISSAESGKMLTPIIKQLEKKCKTKGVDEEWKRLLTLAKDTKKALEESLMAEQLIKKLPREEGIHAKFLDPLLEIMQKPSNDKNAQVAKLFVGYIQSGQISDVELKNIYILFELLGISLDAQSVGIEPTKLSCLGLQIPKEVAERVNEQVATIQAQALEIAPSNTGWQEALSAYTQLEALHSQLMTFRSAIRDEVVAAVQPETRRRLEQAGICEPLIDEYLNDPQRSATRVFEHTELFLDSNPFAQLTKMLSRRIADLQNAMVAKIRSDYAPKGNSGGGDCFFYSCNDHINKSMMDWRRDVCTQLRQPQYERIIGERLANDDMAMRAYAEAGEVPQEQYCNWMAQAGNWGSAPELQAFSDLVGRPVIVVQSLGPTFDWSAGFNLALTTEPLIFINHSAVHYEAMLRK